MAVISSAPNTTCDVSRAAGMASVWLGKAMAPGPSVMVWPLTTTVVGLGPIVKVVVSMMTLESSMSTPMSSTVVIVGGLGIAIPPSGGRVTVAPTPTTCVGSMVKVFPSTTTVEVGCVGLLVNVRSLMITSLGCTMTVTGGRLVMGADLTFWFVVTSLP